MAAVTSILLEMAGAFQNSRIIEYLNMDNHEAILRRILSDLENGKYFKSIEQSHWCSEIDAFVKDDAWSHYLLIIFSEETRNNVRIIFDKWEENQVYEKFGTVDDDNNPQMVGICVCQRKT